MTTHITTAARRIARRLNEYAGSPIGGFLAFDADGKGGAWYSYGSVPGAAIELAVPLRRVSAHEVQEGLDRREAL